MLIFCIKYNIYIIFSVLMKKTLAFVLLSALISLGWAFAYTPTTQDIVDVAKLNSKLWEITSGKNISLRNYYDQVRNLQTEYYHDDRLNYMLWEMKDYMYDKIYTQKIKAKILSKSFKEDFVDIYSSWINLIEETWVNCTWRYNTLDDLSFIYDLPTSLTTAIWYRESTCGYYLPKNGDGPFQIESKDYGTGQITAWVFIQSVEDFMRFAKHKISRYESANKADQNTGYKINLSYTGFDLTGVVRFGALYNSLSGNTVYGNILPKRPGYVRDGYGEEYSGSIRYGVFPKMIKALERELENAY